MQAILLAFSVLLAAPAAWAGPARAAEALLPATELSLPRYQAELIRADAPEPEFLIGRGGDVWVLGSTALWQWHTATRKLSRLKLHDAKSDGSPLKTLATDGISLFAASRNSIYQVAAGDQRVFRYRRPSPAAGHAAPRFFGFGDDFWWSSGGSLFKLDRYGKRLAPQGDSGPLSKVRAAAFWPASRALYWIDGKRLLRATPEGRDAARVIYQAKQALIDVQAAGGHLVAHTAHSAVRLSPDGRVLQAIPVEGRRRLARMHISEERHAYLFDDQLLEVFDLKSRAAQRYALPIEDSEKIGRLALAGNLAAVIVDDEVRVFRLGAAPE